MIELLFIIILINFCFGLRYSTIKANPITIYSAGFLIASIICLIYKKEWQMDTFHIDTFILIGGGISVFSLFSYITYQHLKSKLRNKKLNLIRLQLPSKYIILLIIINIITHYLIYKQIISYSFTDDLGDAIASIDRDFKRGDSEFELPLLLRNLRFLLECFCYFFMMVLARHLTVYKIDRFSLLLSLYILISFFGGFLSGSRGGSMTMILYFGICYYCIKSRIKSSRKTEKINYFKLISVIAICLVVFVLSTQLVGRSTDEFGNFYYLAFYLGAEIKNLDIFVQNLSFTHSDLWGEYTFSNIYQIFSQNIGSGKNIHYFNWLGNYMLGNVYTCFQNYYIDFGVGGTMIIVAISAIIIQYLYARSNNSVILNSSFFDFRLFLYAFITRKLALSFFSEQFYSLIDIGFLKFCIEIYLISYLSNKYFSLKVL